MCIVEDLKLALNGEKGLKGVYMTLLVYVRIAWRTENEVYKI